MDIGCMSFVDSRLHSVDTYSTTGSSPVQPVATQTAVLTTALMM